MLGIWGQHAALFAVGFAALTTFVFALPFIFATELWARTLGWSVPEDRDLARYFARCLGFLALGFSGAMVAAAVAMPKALALFFGASIFFCTAMVALHIYGWLRREQPPAETAEIPLWAAAALAFVLFFPA